MSRQRSRAPRRGAAAATPVELEVARRKRRRVSARAVVAYVCSALSALLLPAVGLAARTVSTHEPLIVALFLVAVLTVIGGQVSGWHLSGRAGWGRNVRLALVSLGSALGMVTTAACLTALMR